MTDTIRILIADDHHLVREGLARILEVQPDFEVVGGVADGSDVLTSCRELRPHVLLLDVTMPGPGFLEILSRLRKRESSPAVLVISGHPEEKYAIRSLKAGADGYLSKGERPSILSRAIRRLAGGGTYVSEHLASALATELRQGDEPTGHEALTEREYQVFLKLGAGKSLSEIGAELSLSPKTIGTYRTRILQKLGLRRTADLIRYAVEQGLAD